MMPSICFVLSAGKADSKPPSAAVLTPSVPQPSCTERRRTSQSVSEPAVVTASVVPLRSRTVLIAESAATITEILRGSAAKAATAVTGEPFTAKAMDGPLPRPKSTLSEVSACCSFASPVRTLISTSRPYLAKIPSSTPTSSGINDQATPTDFPARTLSAAMAGAKPAPLRDRPRRAEPINKLRNIIAIFASRFHGEELGGEKLVIARFLGEDSHTDKRLL